MIFPNIDCEPEEKTLDELKAMKLPPGTMGITEMLHEMTYSTDFEGFSDQTCTAKLKKEPKLSLTKFAYVKPGTYSDGTETPKKGRCRKKKLDKKIEVTSDLSDKAKAAEVEHCNDDKLAFALSSGIFAQAIKELATPFCAKGAKSCLDEAKIRWKARTGIAVDDWGAVALCLSGKSKDRDKSPNNWHTVNLGKPTYDRKCKTALYKPDASKMTNVGKHASKDVVKGCGEKWP